MVKSRKTPPAKTRAILQQEIGSQCPFCRNEDAAHFVVHHIDGNPAKNDLKNLLMVCPTCHSKITKGDISSVEVVGVRATLLKVKQLRKNSSDGGGTAFYGNLSHSVVGNNNRVTYNTKTTQRPKYPTGCIGSDIAKGNYVSYLITRYHEYKEWEIGKENMRYAVFPSQLKSKYHIGTQRTIYHLPLAKFDDLIEEIQKRISGTALAKINTAKEQNHHFLSFAEYVAQNG